MKTFIIKTFLVFPMLILILFPPLVNAERFDSFQYKIIGDNTITITYCDRTITEIILPSKINGLSVSSIDTGSFMYCYNLKNVVIPNSVSFMGDCIFDNCTALETITLSNNIVSIGDRAFYNCSSLSKITIPNAVTSIGNYAFFDCSKLADIIIPDNITFIGAGAFSGCSSLKTAMIGKKVTNISDNLFSHCDNLTTITIPNSVKKIGYNAFSNCPALTTIKYDGTPAEWAEISIANGNDYLKNATIDYNITTNTTIINNTLYITPVNIPIKSIVAIACYRENLLTEVNFVTYDGSKTIIYTPNVSYDSVKILIWKDLQTLTPLCNGEMPKRT